MKIERRLFTALSAFAAVREQPISEAYQRLNLEGGCLEATDGKGGYQLKLSSAWAKFLDPCQILPTGFVSPLGLESDYPKAKVSKAKEVELAPINPKQGIYSRENWRSFAALQKAEHDASIRLPVMALESIVSFCQSERFDFERHTDQAVCLFLSTTELTLIQRWQQASRLVVPYLPDQVITPVGQQFLCCLPVRLLQRTAELLAQMYWQKQQFLTLKFTTPKGWNNSFNPQPTAGLHLPLELSAEGADRAGLFDSAFIQLATLHLSEDSAAELSSPQFPILMGGAKVSLHRS